MQTEKCYLCGQEIPDGAKFKEDLVVSVDIAGRNIGQTHLKKCMKCFEKEEPVVIADKVIPRSQARLF